MPNLYANLGVVKAELRLSASATADDAQLLRLIERASRQIDRRTGRQFYSETATRYLDGRGKTRLWVPDLISITTLKVDDNADDTYELTMVASTDYWLVPDNPIANQPYHAIDINPRSTQLGAWPRGRRTVQIVGSWGYSAEYEASGTLGAAITTTDGTSVTMTAGHGLTGGETILVGSEQMYVSAVSTNTLTGVRGVNGTTAATASNGAAVTRRRYDRNIEAACVIRTADLWRGIQTGYGAGVSDPELGGFVTREAYAQFVGLTRELACPVVA